jgi:hypothetical protein
MTDLIIVQNNGIRLFKLDVSWKIKLVTCSP